MNNLNFAESQWSTGLNWKLILPAEELPLDDEFGTSAVALVGSTEIAVFRSAENRVFATHNMCGHRRAFILSEGLVGSDSAGTAYIACPLHSRKFYLEGARAGYTPSGNPAHTIATFQAKEENGGIWIRLPATEELDEVLGNDKWKAKAPQSRGPGMRAGRGVAREAPHLKKQRHGSASPEFDSEDNPRRHRCAVDALMW